MAMPIFLLSSITFARTAYLFRFAILLLILLSGNAWSDHPTMSVGSGLAGPINTLPAETLPQGQWTTGLRYEYLELDPISDSKLEQLTEAGETVHSTDSVSSLALSVAYGITDDLMLVGNLPYVSRKNIRETGGHHDETPGVADAAAGVEKLGDSEGIGDASVYGMYRFVNNPQNGMQVSVLGGVKMPTGDTNEKTNEGGLFEAEHQPGSGSWDPLLGIAMSMPVMNSSLGASVLYQISTEGDQDTTIGDAVFYSVAVAHRLGESDSHAHHDHGAHAAWDLILELNGEWREKVDINGVSDGDTGGHALFFAPGIRYSATHNWAAALSFGVPIIKNLNGTQSEPDWRAVANIGYAF
jgi:hypothetical protein